METSRAAPREMKRMALRLALVFCRDDRGRARRRKPGSPAESWNGRAT